MGELLRRYWAPIGAVAELDDNPIKPIRLMNEDLVLYKDLSGQYGLVDRHCPHRRADLSYGWVEECGLRCNYHGWLWDESGACAHQPFEEISHPDARFKERVHIKAYPVEAKAGLLWAYMGPARQETAGAQLRAVPARQRLRPDRARRRARATGSSARRTRSIRCTSNGCTTPGHESYAAPSSGPPPPTHLKLNFVEFEHGFQYQRVRQGQSEDDELWTVGRVSLWPHGFYLGSHFEWRIPVDDENCLSVCWFYQHVPKEREPFVQDRIPYWYAPLKDEQTGRWITSHTVNQDFVGWVGQGAIADRTREHLGESDRGVILLRRRMLEEARQGRAEGSIRRRWCSILRRTSAFRCRRSASKVCGPVGRWTSSSMARRASGGRA